MAHVESAAATSPNARSAACHQNECSSATARSNRSVAPALQDTGNLTRPSRSADAGPCSCTWAASETHPSQRGVAKKQQRARRVMESPASKYTLNSPRPLGYCTMVFVSLTVRKPSCIVGPNTIVQYPSGRGEFKVYLDAGD